MAMSWFGAPVCGLSRFESSIFLFLHQLDVKDLTGYPLPCVFRQTLLMASKRQPVMLLIILILAQRPLRPRDILTEAVLC